MNLQLPVLILMETFPGNPSLWVFPAFFGEMNHKSRDADVCPVIPTPNPTKSHQIPPNPTKCHIWSSQPGQICCSWCWKSHGFTGAVQARAGKPAGNFPLDRGISVGFFCAQISFLDTEKCSQRCREHLGVCQARGKATGNEVGSRKKMRTAGGKCTGSKFSI